ncbi:family 16 glycosylhydrolase [Myxococcus stipitatus]|uniref:family 16 glycosylhydrolase n=1 Tax=Myxococcus stipitatus TaxID=83455 RepID=UPI003AF224D2
MERQYGDVEVRLDAPTGAGTWPAAWMMGSTGGWPANGEFDLFEGEGSPTNRIPFMTHPVGGADSSRSGQAGAGCVSFPKKPWEAWGR